MSDIVQIGRTSSAAKTVFCTARIDGPGGHHMWIDGNGKVTAGNGTLDDPRPNAFSLPAGNRDDRREHCPGSTAVCRKSCYVHGLESAVPDTFALYEHNATTIRAILADPDLAVEWAAVVGAWITENASGGFRWHVSGDIFSDAYAQWIADVAMQSHTVRHWIYTRSFDVVDIEPLIAVSTNVGGNVALNLSVDADNYEAARLFAQVRRGWWDLELRLCYLSHDGSVPSTLPPGSVIFPDYAFRAPNDAPSPWYEALPKEQRPMVCPVDHRGKSEARRCGPCSRCL